MVIKFIQAIGLELEMIKELVEPLEDIKPGEEEVGEISEDLRLLYTFWKNTGKTAGALFNEIEWANASPEVQARAYELNVKAQVLHAILWVAIQDELQQWGEKRSLALRRGWKVVVTPPQQPGFPMFKFW